MLIAFFRKFSVILYNVLTTVWFTDHNIHNHMNKRLSKSGRKNNSVVLSHSVYGSQGKKKKNQDWKVGRFGHMMIIRGLSKGHFRGEFWEMKGKWKSGNPVSMPAPIHPAVHPLHQTMLWVGASRAEGCPGTLACLQSACRSVWGTQKEGTSSPWLPLGEHMRLAGRRTKREFGSVQGQ